MITSFTAAAAATRSTGTPTPPQRTSAGTTTWRTFGPASPRPATPTAPTTRRETAPSTGRAGAARSRRAAYIRFDQHHMRRSNSLNAVRKRSRHDREQEEEEEEGQVPEVELYGDGRQGRVRERFNQPIKYEGNPRLALRIGRGHNRCPSARTPLLSTLRKPRGRQARRQNASRRQSQRLRIIRQWHL